MYNKKDSEQVGMTDQGKLMRNYNVAANFSLRRMNAGARPGDPTSRKACGYYTLHPNRYLLIAMRYFPIHLQLFPNVCFPFIIKQLS